MRERERDGQLRDAARHAADLGARTVLIGDFNASPWSPIYDNVLEISDMRDSRRGFGVQATWIARFPAFLRIPIDHAFVTPDVEVIDRRVGPYVGSDHRAVVLDLR